MRGDSDLDHIGTGLNRRRRHTNSTLLEAELVAQARSSMVRLTRRAERLTGRRPDWEAQSAELEALLRLAPSQHREHVVRTFGIAGFLPGTSHNLDRRVEKLYVARVGSSMRRPLINESRDLEHDSTDLVYAPFLSAPHGVVVQERWLDLRTWDIAGSIAGYIRLIDEPVRLFPQVGLTDSAGRTIRIDDEVGREAITDPTARAWGWRPGMIVPCSFALCRRETDGVVQMEILRRRDPF